MSFGGADRRATDFQDAGLQHAPHTFDPAKPPSIIGLRREFFGGGLWIGVEVGPRL